MDARINSNKSPEPSRTIKVEVIIKPEPNGPLPDSPPSRHVSPAPVPSPRVSPSPSPIPPNPDIIHRSVSPPHVISSESENSEEVKIKSEDDIPDLINFPGREEPQTPQPNLQPQSQLREHGKRKMPMEQAPHQSSKRRSVPQLQNSPNLQPQPNFQATNFITNANNPSPSTNSNSIPTQNTQGNFGSTTYSFNNIHEQVDTRNFPLQRGSQNNNSVPPQPALPQGNVPPQAQSNFQATNSTTNTEHPFPSTNSNSIPTQNTQGSYGSTSSSANRNDINENSVPPQPDPQQDNVLPQPQPNFQATNATTNTGTSFPSTNSNSIPTQNTQGSFGATNSSSNRNDINENSAPPPVNVPPPQPQTPPNPQPQPNTQAPNPPNPPNQPPPPPPAQNPPNPPVPPTHVDGHPGLDIERGYTLNPAATIFKFRRIGHRANINWNNCPLQAVEGSNSLDIPHLTLPSTVTTFDCNKIGNSKHRFRTVVDLRNCSNLTRVRVNVSCHGSGLILPASLQNSPNLTVTVPGNAGITWQ